MKDCTKLTVKIWSQNIEKVAVFGLELLFLSTAKSTKNSKLSPFFE